MAGHNGVGSDKEEDGSGRVIECNITRQNDEASYTCIC